MIRFSLFFTLAVGTFLGCSGGPDSQGAGTSNPEVAQSIQGQVDEFILKAKNSSARAKGELNILLESLEGAADRSPAFAKVRDEAKALQELYGSNAAKPQIEEQTNALKASAEALTQ